MSYEQSYGDNVQETYENNAYSAQYSNVEHPLVSQYTPQSPYPPYTPPPMYGFVSQYIEMQVSEPGKSPALAGLILSICSLIFFWFIPIGFPLAIAGISASAAGMRSVSRRGIAIAGLVLSIITLIIAIGFFLIVAIVSLSAAYN